MSVCPTITAAATTTPPSSSFWTFIMTASLPVSSAPPKSPEEGLHQRGTGRPPGLQPELVDPLRRRAEQVQQAGREPFAGKDYWQRR
jgi:hypothetical protein